MTQAFTQTHAHDLRVRLSGPVVASGDTEYEEVRKIWNASIDNRPAAFARCTGYEDVVAALKFAHVHDMEVAGRGGGHNVAGTALSNGGLVIDLQLMNAIAGVEAFLRHSTDVLDEAGQVSAWEAVQAAEPTPHIVVKDEQLSARLEVFADFADLKSPFTARHSRATLESAPPRPRLSGRVRVGRRFASPMCASSTARGRLPLRCDRLEADWFGRNRGRNRRVLVSRRRRGTR